MWTIYFDYNATTLLDPAVREAMLPFLDAVWGNPPSVPHVGRQARAALDDARERTANILHCKPREVVFTSGGTESVNFALLGAAHSLKAKGRHLITSTIEHHAVLRACDCLPAQEGFAVTHLPVDAEGRLSPDALKRALRPDTVLVSVMAANKQIGTLQPVAELGALSRARGVVFHTDAVQWFRKEPFIGSDQFNANLVSICAHKFHGPKGAGALYIRSPLQPHPTLFGGAHESERRAGTENLAAIVGLAAAVERFVVTPVFAADGLRRLTASLIGAAERIPGVRFVGSRTERLANTAAFVVDAADSISLLAALDLGGICASGGAACSAGSLKTSHVVHALGLDPALAHSLLRFSLGRSSSAAEVAFLTAVLPEIVRRAQHGEQTPAGR